jgi:Domain of unknown function (DUF1877).
MSRKELNDFIKSPIELSDFLYSDDRDIFDIDQAWHGIHFLLTGNTENATGPLNYVVLGGHAIYSEEDSWEYGPPLYKTVEEVREAYKALSEIDIDDLRIKYDPEKFEEADIFPGNWDEEGIDFLLSYLDELNTYFKTAATNNEAIIFWLD